MLQGWPGGLPRGRGAHQGGRGGRQGRQIAAGSKIISGYYVTCDRCAPVRLTCMQLLLANPPSLSSTLVCRRRASLARAGA
jgi:hypothetical protein